jgi:hypothetical protein
MAFEPACFSCTMADVVAYVYFYCIRHRHDMPDHPVWQGSLAETKAALEKKNLIDLGKPRLHDCNDDD